MSGTLMRGVMAILGLAKVEGFFCMDVVEAQVEIVLVIMPTSYDPWNLARLHNPQA
jgi:hypothetical protein